MKRAVMISCFSFLSVLVCTYSVPAQTLNTILAKLQTVEERLNEHEKNSGAEISKQIDKALAVRLASIESDRKSEQVQVKSNFAKVDSLAINTQIDSTIASLRSQIDLLQESVKEMKNTIENQADDESKAVAMAPQNNPLMTAAGMINHGDQAITTTSSIESVTPVNNSTMVEIDYTRSPLEIEHVYSGEYFSKIHGGMEKKNRGDYRGNFDLTVSASSEALGLWKGTTFSVDFQNGNGRGISESYVGDYQVLSNIDAGNFTQISEYTLCHSFAGNRFMIKLGKQDANEDFNVADNAGDFINSSFGIMPNVPLPTFPDPGLGISVFYTLSDNIQIKAGLFDGLSHGGSWGFNTAFSSHGESSSVMELSYGSSLLPFFKKRGTFKIGLWRHGGLYAPVAGTGSKSENLGGYCIYEQGILGYAESDHHHVDMFLQYGYADREISAIPNYAGIGFKADGLITGRPDDSMGIGAACALVNPEMKDMKGETAFEYYYQTTIMGKLTLQPDVQYIINPGGMYDNALVTGMRVYINF
ncbi:carbohydrate porin [bacterium]|nr:carbohydrate porin [bacterium]